MVNRRTEGLSCVPTTGMGPLVRPIVIFFEGLGEVGKENFGSRTTVKILWLLYVKEKSQGGFCGFRVLEKVQFTVKWYVSYPFPP